MQSGPKCVLCLEVPPLAPHRERHQDEDHREKNHAQQSREATQEAEGGQEPQAVYQEATTSSSQKEVAVASFILFSPKI